LQSNHVSDNATIIPYSVKFYFYLFIALPLAVFGSNGGFAIFAIGNLRNRGCACGAFDYFRSLVLLELLRNSISVASMSVRLYLRARSHHLCAARRSW